MEIKHPEWLQVREKDRICYGYDQSWYKTSFKRTRGCGPTAAAMLLSYLNLHEGKILPLKTEQLSEIIEVMEIVWTFVTPNWLLGLYSTNRFCQGMIKLFQHYQVNWHCSNLGVPVKKKKRPSMVQVVSFLEESFQNDCPVAFLNLQKGQAYNMENWHWTLLVSINYDQQNKRYLATSYDQGRAITFDLGVWLGTTKLGGGFVSVF